MDYIARGIKDDADCVEMLEMLQTEITKGMFYHLINYLNNLVVHHKAAMWNRHKTIIYLHFFFTRNLRLKVAKI